MSEEEQAWADAILADPSDAQLLVWADWLEENGDEACEGVRWLVERGTRPYEYAKSIYEYTWWRTRLTDKVFAHLSCKAGSCREANYTWRDRPRAEAHLTALLDAARAYVRSKSLALATPP